MTNLPLLSSLDMARFAARGFLRFDAVVPDEINAQFLADVAAPGEDPAVVGQCHRVIEIRRDGGEVLEELKNRRQ